VQLTPPCGSPSAVVQRAVTLVRFLVFNPFPFGTGGDGRATRWLPQLNSLDYNACMKIQLEELRKLPVAEKLHIVEELWDDISNSDERLILRDWHKDEARRRAEELEANPDLAITRDELWKRVDEANG
jgi:putative addiction module component (TIGR02574 family)